ncbi:MAG: Ig-like domain-containing protein [Verrucomicrobia bacterium]|nr:Ig-like domain-containing protein [Verrucomicrobiota bacterium]
MYLLGGRGTPNGLTGIFGRLSFATNQNIGPAVNLTAPANNVTVVPGSSVNVAANASDFDGYIERVEFYVDGSLVFTDYEAPYGFTWTAPMTQRNYTLMARAYDNEGASTNSPTRTITVYTDNLPPAVAIISPADQAAFPRGTQMQVSVNASDPDGTVTRVELYSNGQLVASKTSGPWTFLWNAPAGFHTLTARATDNANATSQSLPVEIVVGGPPQPKLIAINFKDNPATDINETATGGYYWNSVANHTFSKGLCERSTIRRSLTLLFKWKQLVWVRGE